MADESAIIAEFLYSKLNVAAINALVSTRIYDTNVPQKPSTGQTVLFPCIVFQMQAPQDVVGIGGVRIFVRPLWVVKVIVDDESTFKIAGTIFSLVDQALQGATNNSVMTDGTVYTAVREGDGIRFSEPKIGGGNYKHRGGVYRIEARATITP